MYLDYCLNIKAEAQNNKLENVCVIYITTHPATSWTYFKRTNEQTKKTIIWLKSDLLTQIFVE